MKNYNFKVETIYKKEINIEANNEEEAFDLIDKIITNTNVLDISEVDNFDEMNVEIVKETDIKNEEIDTEDDLYFEENYNQICEEYEEENCKNCEHWCSFCNECILGED